MARIFTICNAKGGVGKSTSVQGLGAFLAAYGKKVLIVDFDAQANTTSGVGAHPRRIERGVYHALIGQVPAEDVIKKTQLLGVDLLPATAGPPGAPRELGVTPNQGQ